MKEHLSTLLAVPAIKLSSFRLLPDSISLVHVILAPFLLGFPTQSSKEHLVYIVISFHKPNNYKSSRRDSELLK